MQKIYILDDDKLFMKSLERVLKSIGDYDINLYTDIDAFFEDLAEYSCDLVLLDLNMPKTDGKECLIKIKEWKPDAPVIMISGEKDANTALECLRLGAFDYVTKPIDINRLEATLKNVFRLSDLEKDIFNITKHLMGSNLESNEDFNKIITCDSAMRLNFRYIEAISKSSNHILICGETGTGKELIAEAVHKSSRRRGDFIAVDVSGLDDNVFSDTLFGHVKGAFTGADKIRQGLIEKASNGTLFLDEIGDLEEASQIKLLRLLQMGTYYPLGSDEPRKSSARIVAAVNKDIEQLLRKSFREDLYYRLSMHRIDVPPLRERKGDIKLLASLFYSSAIENYNIKNELDSYAVGVLTEYTFPGNVRELKSIIEDAALQQSIGFKLIDVLKKKTGRITEHGADIKLADIFGYFPTLEQLAEYAVKCALDEAGNSQQKAAELLGISRQALNRRINILKSKTAY